VVEVVNFIYSNLVDDESRCIAGILSNFWICTIISNAIVENVPLVTKFRIYHHVTDNDEEAAK